MPKVSALPEDTLPTLDDFTYTLDTTSSTAEKTKWQNVLKMLLGGIYPVGAIYTETTGVNPNTTFGFGTWAAFGAGRTLVGVGTSDAAYAAGVTGGESTHVLTWDELAVHGHGVNDPGHSHTYSAWRQATYPGGGILGGGGLYGNPPISTGSTGGSGTGISLQNAGLSAAHNNMPPYVVVYFWKRTA